MISRASVVGSKLKAAVFRHTVFFVTHHLFVLFFALITIHATNDYNKKTWKVMTCDVISRA